MSAGIFVTGTGTGVGKTHFTRALVLALRASGRDVFAVKPVETGCVPVAEDARALALASGHPELENAPGLVRLEPALAPGAIDVAKPDLDALVASVRAMVTTDAVLVVEGAGGLLVPYDDATDFADFAVRLGLPIVIVAANRLGVIHDVRATVEAAERRGLTVQAVVLSAVETPDASVGSNARVIGDWVKAKVIVWPRVDAEAARDEALRLGVLRVLGLG
jgi:dethiobiotin synthetase